ncbi:hypothetical protein C1H46_012904 [Malus baccata]|uniref:Uncharacterized protein n=1 Tax=Malus baccata TaxID=106549 RepID=A0A540MRZ4_MALBA|nr:hypothetical protein C1H46_012904 [Malus baccata]
MANPQHLLCEKTPLKINALQKTLEIAILFFFVCVLVYRLLSLRDHGFVWLLAFTCESWFAFSWALTLITQWTPVEYKTYPHNLLQHCRDSLCLKSIEEEELTAQNRRKGKKKGRIYRGKTEKKKKKKRKQKKDDDDEEKERIKKNKSFQFSRLQNGLLRLGVSIG